MTVMVLASARSALELAAAKGTAVTATRILYFAQGTHDQNIATIAPSELRASYAPTYRDYPGMEHDTFTMNGDATFDDLSFWLRAAVHGGTAVIGVGATADKTWTFTPTLTTDDLDAITLEFAYTDLLATVGWRVPGTQVDEFTLKWEQGKEVTWDAKLVSFKGATQITAFTGALTDRVNVTALGTNTQTYIDTTTLGSTTDSNVISHEWTLKNNLVPLETLNNTNTGAALLRTKPYEWMLKTRRYFANAIELNAYIAKTERKVRVKTLGPTLGSSNYQLQLDCYGYWDVSKTADASGIIVADLELKPVQDVSATKDYVITLVNSLATIT